jgi:hypothetical protein
MNAAAIPVLSAVIGIVAVLSAGQDQAVAQDGPQRECFSARSVNGFNPVDEDTVDIRVGANRRYRLELVGYCPDVDWSMGIALRTRGGSSWICQGMDAELIVPSPTGRQNCLVSSVRRLSEAEVKASRRRN